MVIRYDVRRSVRYHLTYWVDEWACLYLEQSSNIWRDEQSSRTCDSSVYPVSVQEYESWLCDSGITLCPQPHHFVIQNSFLIAQWSKCH